ncbi:hypothetical protein N0V88_000046 [Collariella sp. IMI 366227]|nr:hypothetical protein N0V88_000046 [Collariella sp. IMI 366227]
MAHPLSQPGSETATPYLHPLQIIPGHKHKVRETHKANVEHDYATGRKHINNYEIIEELGRGMHGKVKLARNIENGEYVAIKIIPRFSKRRRLGKLTAMSTQDKSKREIAILKKIRHPNVVALLEIIDDPELKKIYMVLEHVELGEVVWRKKGLPHICEYERRRIEREMRGAQPTPEEERFERLLMQRQAAKDAERARLKAQAQTPSTDYWSLEYGPTDDDELGSHFGSLGRDDTGISALRRIPSNTSSVMASRATSRAPSRTQSNKSLANNAETTLASLNDLEALGTSSLNPGSAMTALDGTMYGAYTEDPTARGRSPSMADSILSHLSSFDFNKIHDPYVDDFSYVPCFTIVQARNTFRDTVLGLEYLHYEGVVHRDIKPANLLWTKDKRTKIADFGVSYFGRPTRDGEPDDTISESEAKDFDNDLELAKTVGTPAFFAPELCATDLFDNPHGKQPKITEQIDVWSLGVTLYCLIYARLPFLAEDEWQMFKKIANEDVYIPDRRLGPVDPSTKPIEKSLYTRTNGPQYRDDDDLAYEDIEPDLRDLLTRMLTKDPEKRIRLGDVKRHPWVLKDVENKWIDNTDPSRRTSGKKIQVDKEDMARAVVPLTLLERARSAVKKAVGKVMHPRGERTESVSSRRRATSSAASSAGESSVVGLITPNLRDSRRRSIRPDDYFSSPVQPSSGHPLTHSVLASPQERTPTTPHAPSAPHHQFPMSGPRPYRAMEILPFYGHREDHWARHSSASPHRSFPRHGHARSVTNAFLSLTPAPMEIRTLPPTPLFGSPLDDPSSILRKAQDTKPIPDELGRARSVDRGLFASADKRAEAKVAVTTAIAPGSVQFTPQPRPSRTNELAKELEQAVSTALPLPRTANKSDPPCTNPTTPPPNTPANAAPLNHPSSLPRLPSSDSFSPAPAPPPPLSRGDTVATTAGQSSSSTTSIGAINNNTITTPLTSPSVAASSPVFFGLSNVAATNMMMAKEAANGRMMAFQSDPSLPALLSSATSSVSAADFLEGSFGGAVPPPVVRSHLGHRRASRHRVEEEEEDDDSDSDEGLVMMKRTKKPVVAATPASPASAAVAQSPMGSTRLVGCARRRDTNASVGSTETAKKVFVDSD